MTIQISEQMLNSKLKQYSIKLPEELHKAIKAEAAVLGKTKNKLMEELIVKGANTE